MKKFVFILALAAVSVAAATANRSAAKGHLARQAVPGTEIEGNTAKAKAGYRFVKNRRAADVVRTRMPQVVGTYICVNGTTGQADHCYLEITPKLITCTGEASGNGHCALRQKLSAMN